MCETTRSIIWRTLVSRLAVPSFPRKYFDATTFVAVCDQDAGASTPFCSKTFPPSPGMTASRSSHEISSYGWTPSLVNVRRTRSPRGSSAGVLSREISAMAIFPCLRVFDH